MQTGPLITTFRALSSIDTSWILWPDAAAIIGNAYLIISTSAVAAFFLVGLTITIKYYKYLLNDFKTLSNLNIPDIAVKLWFALVLLLPLFLDAGPVWFTVWWAIIFSGYINRIEKRLIIFALICILISGWYANLGGNLITYASTNNNTEIFLVEQGFETTEDVQRLADHVNKYADDNEAANALAVALIRKGENDKAVSIINRCLSNEPENPLFYNTMGIALAAEQKHREASGYFENAVKLGPKEVIYYFNLSRSYLEMFDIYEADKYVDKMTELDPREANRLLSRNTYPMYAYKKSTLQTMLSRQMKESEKGTIAKNELWRAALGVFNPEWALFSGLASLCVFILAGFIPRDKFTQKCSKCGNSYYVGALNVKGYPICLQCSLIENRSKKQNAIVVQHKLMEIKNFNTVNQKRSARLELILPGLGSMMVNRSFRSFIFFFVFSLSIVLIASGGTFIYSFMPSSSDYRMHLRAFGIVLLVILYLTALRYPPVKRGV